jgi:two-component system CheB/CheR fusion protein
VAVEADSGRIEQAITNLLTNASSYSDSGSAIELEATLEDGGIQIVVIDSGIGFDNEEASHLFDLFSRGERARNHFANGLGIGLHLTREIVTAHGGRVKAHSEGPGKGSRFEIWLPVLSGDAFSAGPGASPQGLGKPV